MYLMNEFLIKIKTYFRALFVGYLALASLACSSEYSQMAAQEKRVTLGSPERQSRIGIHSKVSRQHPMNSQTLNYYGSLDIKNTQKYYEYLRITELCEEERAFSPYVCKPKDNPLYIEVHNLTAGQDGLHKADVFLMPLANVDIFSEENNPLARTIKKTFYKSGDLLKSRFNFKDSPDRLALHFEGEVAVRADLIYQGEIIASGPIHR